MTPARHDCPCGRPIHDTANLCHPCVEALRSSLVKIADRWLELEGALSWREVIVGEKGRVKNGMVAVGTTLNESAVKARRCATDAVWFALQVVRDDSDAAGVPFTPPRLLGARSQDQTPALARWLAATQLRRVAYGADPESSAEILRDVERAERATYNATHPSSAHWISVNLACELHATTDQGDRVPCPGHMGALVGMDVMPDLVCDADPTHVISPAVWERAGWKRRLAGPLDPRGAGRLHAALRLSAGDA